MQKLWPESHLDITFISSMPEYVIDNSMYPDGCKIKFNLNCELQNKQEKNKKINEVGNITFTCASVSLY